MPWAPERGSSQIRLPVPRAEDVTVFQLLCMAIDGSHCQRRSTTCCKARQSEVINCVDSTTGLPAYIP